LYYYEGSFDVSVYLLFRVADTEYFIRQPQILIALRMLMLIYNMIF
jgi:hypothetical protein